MAERRQIHRILHHAQLEVIAHLAGNLDADGFLRLGRRAGDVRRQNHVVQFGVRRVFRGLFDKHIQRRAGHLPALQGLDQGRIFNQFAARAVDDAHALLHLGQRFGVDHAGGLRRQAHVQA